MIAAPTEVEFSVDEGDEGREVSIPVLVLVKAGYGVGEIGEVAMFA